MFEHLVEHQLVVCRICRHAVWPNQIAGHLQGKQHGLKRQKAREMAREIEGWPGVIKDPGELWVPMTVERPFCQLPLYPDGFRCILEPARCHFIGRGKESIRRHWRRVHGWAVVGKKGGSGPIRRRMVEQREGTAAERVQCQRFFTVTHGSQYFAVCPSDRSDPDAVQPGTTDKEARWAEIQRKMDEKLASIRQKAQDTIQEGEKTEVNPWLQRTGWQEYLMGLERPDLLACVEEPDVSMDASQWEREDEVSPEAIDAQIWKAMDGMIRFSQESVTKRIGVFVRMEAIRTEKHQTRYQPLQAYMDEHAFAKHTYAWKQIVMFFARTQREHDWESPKYRFTKRQRQTWHILVETARRMASGEGSDEDSEGESETDTDGEGEEEGQEGEADEEDKPRKTTSMQAACLDFCIQLLNQRTTRKEYDSALVCALAVLGVKEGGWKGPEQYPPILSAVIKVARFMVVQKALQISEPFADEEFEDDSGYDSGDSPPPPGKGCLQFVQEMMDHFMVRGSHSPMQWMLDLRTYGLKIHYNTTSPGHVGWKGRDELLYKEMNFTMGQFRGMIHGLRAECRRLLKEDLLVGGGQGEDVPAIPWNELRDNPTNAQAGWNFMQDARTKLPVDGRSWLFDRIGRDEQLRERFMKMEHETGVDRQAVERYMTQVREFREKLLVLAHTTGGQPGRAPEILSVRHSNTIQGGHRNIFIEDGKVVFVTVYHKGYTLSGDVKVIHRYLPREVGELVVWYLWLVLPFVQRMEALVWGTETMSAHMWPKDVRGTRWTSERMRRVMKRESKIGLGQEMNIQAYREIAIGISRRFMRGKTAFPQDGDGEGQEGGGEDEDEEIADHQAGHGSHIAGMIYARDVMEQSGVMASKRERFRASSEDWHRFLGFETANDWQGVLGRRKRAPFEAEAEEGRMDRWKRLRRMELGGELRRMMGEGAAFRGEQERITEAIVRGRNAIVGVMPTGAGKSLSFMLPAWMEQGGTTVVVVPLVALRGDMKRRCSEVGISCEEWDARRQPDGAAIVFVTPESAVKAEFATFLNRLRMTQQLDRIVIDECHVVLNRQFKFRKEMQQLGKLVAAETQMVMLTATLPPSEEEELFRRMHMERERVVMFRSSTARKNVRYGVLDVNGCEEKEKGEKVMRYIEGEVRKCNGRRGGKVIVYGNTVKRVKEIAERLGCEAYHSKTVDKSEILGEFQAGRQRAIVATSALGMGIDIPDIRCIIHVDRPRTLLDYAQESGRAGRDGGRSLAMVVRDDKEGPEEGKEQSIDEKRYREEQIGLVERYLWGEEGRDRCRRVVLDEYLDGRRDREGCGEDEEKCDVCGGKEREEEEEEVDKEGEEVDKEEEEEEGWVEEVKGHKIEGSSRAFERREFERQGQERRVGREEAGRGRREEGLRVEDLRRFLMKWWKRCGVCEGSGLRGDSHGIGECGREESRRTREYYREVRARMRYEAFGQCFTCGLPQEICEKWEDNGAGRWKRVESKECQYNGALFEGVFGLLAGYREVGRRWMERMREKGVEIEKQEVLISYLGRRMEGWEVEWNNLTGEYHWIAKRVEEVEEGWEL